MYVISGDVSESAQRPVGKNRRVEVPVQDWMISVAVVAGCTVVATIMSGFLELVDIAMIYLLGVIFTASRTHRGPAILASLLSVAAFDFFSIPPFYTFFAHQRSYYITFIVMFIVAFVTSGLTLRVREQADAARQRERSTAALYRLSKELVHERGIERLSAIATKHISDIFSQNAVILVPDEQGHLLVTGAESGSYILDERELSVAQWAFEHRQKAGKGTDTLPGARGLYIPLVASSKTVGAMGIMSDGDVGPFGSEQIHVLENFANQVAMAFERALLAEEAHHVPSEG